jgi:molecular chaperone HscB
MNHFELFDLPVNLLVDTSSLRKTFYRLSREHHPDYYTLSDKSTQEDILAKSTLINEAFKILQDPYRRLEYVLKLNGSIVADEKFDLPPDFLAEMMEINEQLMDHELDPQESLQASIRKQVDLVESALYQEVKTFFETADFSPEPAEWNLLKTYYYKQKYLRRIREKIG